MMATAVSKRSGATSGLLVPGWHKLRILGAEQGLEGQSEPDEPANVLNPNGGQTSGILDWTFTSRQRCGTCSTERARPSRREVRPVRQGGSVAASPAPSARLTVACFPKRLRSASVTNSGPSWSRGFPWK
jgi:hypothetical protein